MTKSQFRFLLHLCLITVILAGNIVILWSITEPAFAQVQDQKKLSSQIKELDIKLNMVNNNYDKLRKDINTIKQDISNNKNELFASKKLLNVYEKNLDILKWVIGVLISLVGVVSVIGSLLIIIIRKGILDKINDEIIKLNAAREKYMEENENQIKRVNQTWESNKKEWDEKWDSQRKESDIMKRDVSRSLAFDFNVAMVDAWEARRLDQAIKFGESAVKYAVEAFGENPEDFDDRTVLERIRSNLAYVYAERNRTDKAKQAIEYAKKGLDVGLATGYLDLIDNFLFVIKVFSRNPNDRILWKKIYEEYKDEIYKSKIREGEEQEEFDKFYKELE